MKLRVARKNRLHRYGYEFKWAKARTYGTGLRIYHHKGWLGYLYRMADDDIQEKAAWRFISRVKRKLEYNIA